MNTGYLRAVQNADPGVYQNEAQNTLSDRGNRIQSFRPASAISYQRRYVLQLLTDFNSRLCLLRGL